MLTRRTFAAAALAAPFVQPARARADAPFKLRASLDTTPAHGRTISIADYLQKLEAASGGRIATQLFDSGQLFADRDVIKALVQGQAEMCAPGTWLVSSFVPDADVLQLPVFYGQPAAVSDKVIDGPIGQMVDAQLQQKLHVRVLGRWIDLGFTNWYSTKKPLDSLDDLRGMKIRNSGGFAQPWRAQFFGAIPNMTAWPDVPLALSQGTFDGLQTTNESIASAKLWEAGLRYALEDHQNMGDYIPMVSDAFFNRLPPDLQALMTTLWAENIEGYRARLAAAQERARTEMIARGVHFSVVPADQLAVVRRRMLAEQDQVAAKMKITPPVLKAIMADVGGA